MELRPVTEADLPEVQAIYAHHVLHGTGSFEEVPPSLEEVAERWQAGTEKGWPWIAVSDATGVLGYAYFSQFRPRSAYRYTAEDSVYVREDVRGQGVGKALVAGLLERAEGMGFRQMVAVIGDSDNVGSIGLHLSLGFRHVGILRSTGIKFGRWLDTVHMQKALGRGDGDLPEEPAAG